MSKNTQKSEKHKIHLNILGEPEAHPNPVRPVAWVKVSQCKDRGSHLQPGNIFCFPNKIENKIYAVFAKILPLLFAIISLEVAEQADEEELKPVAIEISSDKLSLHKGDWT